MYRLNDKKVFASLRLSAETLSHRSFLLLYQSNQLPHCRLGICISKQKLKRAVDRNRVKRIIRASFKEEETRLKGLDILVLLRSKWTPLNNNLALRAEINTLWQRLANKSQVS